MTSHDPTNGPDAPDDDTLAAEYVLHLLPASERERIDALIAVDGAWRARVAAWTERLAVLADDIDDVAPPTALRARLQDAVAPAEGRAMRRAGGRGWLGGWLAGAIGGGLVAALAVVLLTVAIPPVAPPGVDPQRTGAPIYAADVATADQSLVVQANYDPEARVLTVTRLAGQAPEGRALQMWLLTEDQAPHAVGLLPEDGSLTIPVIPFWGQRIPTGRFAVSDEPPGGSTDAVGPTGEILAVGNVREL